jgi:hypothetical protein
MIKKTNGKEFDSMRPLKIREMINNQKQKAVITAASGMGLFAASMLISTVYKGMFSMAWIGFVIAIGGILFLQFGLSCPKCRGRIGDIVNSSIGPFKLSPKIRFCPFCGVALDSDLKH